MPELYPSAKDWTGQRFGMLVAERRSHQKGARWIWVFRCDCGGERTCDPSYAKSSGHCGCKISAIRSKAATRHGMTNTPTHTSWSSMVSRTSNPNDPGWANYGGRGISVCERWHSFEAFLADMGERPSLAHSIDRFPDHDGNYEPGNCRWATRREQTNNRRNTVLLTIDGATKPLTDWSRESGVPHRTIYTRIFVHKWDAKRAVFTPNKPKPRRKAVRA